MSSSSSNMNSVEAARKCMESICTYCSLVEHIATADLSLWNELQMKATLEWAAYCREIALQLNGAGLQEVMEKKLKELDEHLNPALPCKISTHFLKEGVDVTCEAFIFNPTFPESLVKPLIEYLEKDVREKSSVMTYRSALPWCKMERVKCLQDCMDRTQTLVSGLTEQLEEQSPSNATAVVEFVTERKITSNMHEMFEELLLFMESSMESVWARQTMFRLFWKLTKYPHGWSLLVSGLNVNMRKVEASKRENMRRLICLIILAITQRYQKLQCNSHLWEVPPELMAQLAESNDDFMNWYMEVLEDRVDRLDKLREKEAQTSQNPGTSTVTSSAAFCGLVDRFRCLLSRDTELQRKVFAFLCAKSKAVSSEPDGKIYSIWIDLNLDLIDCLN